MREKSARKNLKLRIVMINSGSNSIRMEERQQRGTLFFGNGF